MRQVLAVGIVVLLVMSGLIIVMGEGFNNEYFYEQPTSSFKPTALTPHGIIRINNDQEFFNMKSNESWPGSGSPGSPIIIENYEIDAMGAGNCIYIANVTNTHFIIRNCKLTNASGSTLPWSYGAGITLTNLPNLPYPKAKLENNICINNKIGIFLYVVNFCLIQNNTCNNNSQMGIYIDSSDNNYFLNNTCKNNNENGIFLTGKFLTLARINTFINNTCNSNTNHGIELSISAKDNYLERNQCNDNGIIGILVSGTSDNNNILKNTCNSNGESGILVGNYSIGNEISFNKCIQNNDSGIVINQSNFNKVLFNQCTNHSNGSGITIRLSDLCDVVNNSCHFNKHGIYIVEHSDGNMVINDSCQNNSDGILIEISDNNQINNNSIQNNSMNGIRLIDAAAYNYIKFNNISNNDNGINITGPSLASEFNFISNNLISFNSNHGINIDNGDNNQVHHNNIISNLQQAQDSGTNYWQSNNEGNYWSDYTGFDNGSGGRLAGDGIGDTDIPHLGLDDFPFIAPWGWRVVPKPQLIDPGEYNVVGNYTVNWKVTPRAVGYTLYEDTNWTFDSPIEVYNGTGFSINLKNKDNATYYYMLMAYNDYGYSPWSDKVEIVVDWRPSLPTGLVALQPTGHTVTLFWNPNHESDIMGYKIYMNLSDSVPPTSWTEIAQVDNSTTKYIVQNLTEETTYYFSLGAFDKYSESWEYNDYTFATTRDVTGPTPPENLTATAISDTQINLNWNTSTESDVHGYLVYMARGAINQTYYLIQKINSLNTSFLVTELDEEVTYYFKLKAFDEVPNNSTTFSNIAWATTLDITPPTKPVGLEVIDTGFNTLSMVWERNPESDLVGYFLFRTDDLSRDFKNLTSEPITDTFYNDTGLNESTTYYYYLIAIDDAGLTSVSTDYVTGTTLTVAKPPIINKPVQEFNITEDMSDEVSINLKSWFSDPNNDKLTFRLEGSDHINASINQDTGKVILTPDKDWNGKETLTFFASDGTTEISDSVTITIIGKNDPPGPVEIIEPLDGIEIEHGDLLDFVGSCPDPDVPYGDVLTFKWYSSKDGGLGDGENLTGIKLTTGHHIITLEVADGSGLKASGTIDVNVLKKSDGDQPDEVSGLLLPLLLIIIIIIIVVVVAVVLARRKKRIEEAERGVGVAIKKTLQPGPDVVGLKMPPEAEGVEEPEDLGEPAPEYITESEEEGEEDVDVSEEGAVFEENAEIAEFEEAEPEPEKDIEAEFDMMQNIEEHLYGVDFEEPVFEEFKEEPDLGDEAEDLEEVDIEAPEPEAELGQGEKQETEETDDLEKKDIQEPSEDTEDDAK
jgi:parallel beta-helix repeat protein